MSVETNKNQTFEAGLQSFTLNCICKNVDSVVHSPIEIIAKAPCGTKTINLPSAVHPEIMRAFWEKGLKEECMSCLAQVTR